MDPSNVWSKHEIKTSTFTTPLLCKPLPRLGSPIFYVYMFCKSNSLTGELKSSPTDSLSGEASNSPLTPLWWNPAAEQAAMPEQQSKTRRCRLVVLAIEVGGRWSQEATTFLRLLAQAKARTIPARLKASFTNALIHRWSAQITHAAMTAYAASLLECDCVGSTVTDGNQPLTSEVLAEATPPPAASRVQARP